MRILFFTDPHNSDTPPRMRRDNYTEAILKKQADLILVAKQSADMVIIGGDIFHKKDPSRVSFKLVNKVMEIYREYPNCHILMGNHDYNNHPRESYENPFGMLGHLPNVKLHRDIDYVCVNDLVIKFVPYLEGGLESFTEVFDRGSLDKFEKSLCVAHAPISLVSLPFEYISLDRVIGIYDYLLCGHFHSIQVWEPSFGNPGALSRGTLTLDEGFDRPVGALLLDTYKRPFHATFVNVAHAKAEEVFKHEDAMAKRELAQAIGDFVSHIVDFDIPVSLSKEDLLHQIEVLDIDADVKVKARNILERL